MSLELGQPEALPRSGLAVRFGAAPWAGGEAFAFGRLARLIGFGASVDAEFPAASKIAVPSTFEPGMP